MHALPYLGCVLSLHDLPGVRPTKGCSTRRDDHGPWGLLVYRAAGELTSQMASKDQMAVQGLWESILACTVLRHFLQAAVHIDLNPLHRPLAAFSCCCSSKVYSTTWFMGHYGATTPKQHVGYSNSPCIGSLTKGKSCRSSFARDLKRRGLSQPRTSRKYVDKKGRVRYVGTGALSATQRDPQWTICMKGCSSFLS